VGVAGVGEEGAGFGVLHPPNNANDIPRVVTAIMLRLNENIALFVSHSVATNKFQKTKRGTVRRTSFAGNLRQRQRSRTFLALLQKPPWTADVQACVPFCGCEGPKRLR
jgi:hypothetical protein